MHHPTVICHFRCVVRTERERESFIRWCIWSEEKLFQGGGLYICVCKRGEGDGVYNIISPLDNHETLPTS
jgi:hypothetical protein